MWIAWIALALAQEETLEGRLPRVLFLTRSEGYEHEVVRRPDAAKGTKNTGVRLSLAERQLGEAGKGAFEVVCSQDAGLISAESLKSFDAVALYTSGALPVTPERKQALADFVRRGGALAGIHAAVDSGEAWPELAELLGGRFDSHPWHEEVSLRVEDAAHPSTSFLPPVFKIRDEIYQFKGWSRPGLRVLLSLKEAASGLDKGKRADGDYALAWTREAGRGRVFYTALGHRPEVWEDERFLRHVRGGILWALGGGTGGSGLLPVASDGATSLVLAAGVPAFRLGEDESLHPSLKPAFSVRWEGHLKILQAGTYTLSGEGRIVIGGAEVQGRALPLLPGEHPIRIEVARAPGPSRFQLRWQSDFFGPEPVPETVLLHRESPPRAERARLAERGRDRVEQLNCAGCHRAERGGVAGRKGPDLSEAGGRLKTPWLVRWLQDPKRYRAGASMPVHLEAREAADVSAYLAGLGPRDGGPSFPRDPVRGRELYESVGCLACHGEGGEPLGGIGSKMDHAALAAYLKDPLKTGPGGRMPSLSLSSEEAGAIASYLEAWRNPDFEGAAPAGDAGRGRELVAARGCRACHELRDPGLPEHVLKAPALETLAGEAGCLAPRPEARGLPYALPESQRREILGFLDLHRESPELTKAPIHQFRRTIQTFRCTACHPFGQQEPAGLKETAPLLTQAGHKLREAWLADLLGGTKRLRPWMALRMPRFGEENVRPLISGFGAAAGAEPREDGAPPVPKPEEVKAGIRLAGSGAGGLSCIVCHDFQGRPAGGTRGPDMSTMSLRLRPEWFRRWMRDPGRIQQGSAMPAYFGSFSAEKREETIDVLWSTLGGGASLPLPVGVTSADALRPGGAKVEIAGYKVLVRGEPVLLRTAMPKSSARSIAVGLPGGTSYAFDAERCRLRYVWDGEFLDMAPVWHDRGMRQMGQPGAEPWYRTPDAPLLRLSGAGEAPRTSFKGYLLDEERHPVFLYEVDGVAIRERLSAVEGGRGVVRAFEIAPLPREGWLNPGAEDGVDLVVKPGKLEEGGLRLPAGRALNVEVTVTPRRKP